MVYQLTHGVVCKIPLLARALGLKAKRTRNDRVSCIQNMEAISFRPPRVIAFLWFCSPSPYPNRNRHFRVRISAMVIGLGIGYRVRNMVRVIEIGLRS